MLAIRLSRGGAKKRPYYHIVVADSRSPRDGRFIEKIGAYNPMLSREHADRIKINVERAKYWLGVGARPSDRVTRFLAGVELVKAPERREQPKKSAPKAKAQERAAKAAEAAGGEASAG